MQSKATKWENAMNRRAFLTGATALGLGAAAFTPARAQSFPSNVIRFVVLADAGTTKRMTFDGKDCARAGVKAAAPRPRAVAPVRNARLFMAFSHLVAFDCISCDGASKPDQASAGYPQGIE